MSYNPATDFLTLLRQVGSGVQSERMPGLDYVVAALARAGLFALSVGQAPPTANQVTTVWLKPAQPSWSAEGTVYLWDAATQTYKTATVTGWMQLLSPLGYSFQSAQVFTNIINPNTSLVAVQRNGPNATTLLLPTLTQRTILKPLQIADWSTAVVSHVITLTPTGGASIMQKTSWALLSTTDQLAGITLYPSPDLNGWVIAP